MSTIVTRSGKGSPLTHTEVDDNFTNLNTDKYQSGDEVSFTTLTATGQTSLGGAATNPSFRAKEVISPTRWVEAEGSAAGSPILRAWSTSAATGLLFQTRGATNFTFTTNSSTSNSQLVVAHTASAVNYVQVTGAATTAIPTISAQGSDSSISLNINGKGGASIFFSNNGGNTTSFRVNNTTSSVNYPQITGGVTGSGAVYGVAGTDTNIDLTLTPKGTGATVANGDFKMNSGYGSAATAYGCRAWVNFNGTGTVAIRGSGNVSSITDNGTGNWTINFTTALSDANYSVSGTASTLGATNSYTHVVTTGDSGNNYGGFSTTSVRLNVYGANYASLGDANYVMACIFR